MARWHRVCIFSYAPRDFGRVPLSRAGYNVPITPAHDRINRVLIIGSWDIMLTIAAQAYRPDAYVASRAPIVRRHLVIRVKADVAHDVPDPIVETVHGVIRAGISLIRGRIRRSSLITIKTIPKDRNKS